MGMIMGRVRVWLDVSSTHCAQITFREGELDFTLHPLMKRNAVNLL